MMTTPRAWLFLLFILVSLNWHSSLKAQTTDDVHHDEIKALLTEFSPLGMAVMNLMDTLPQDFQINGITISRSTNKSWSRYIRNPDDVASYLGTTIHEAFHALEGSLSYYLINENQPETFSRKDDYNSYFTVHDQPILAKRTEVFNSHQLKEKIPKDLRAFRYKRYIAQASRVSAQVHGIYGLMEEWNAYYLGNRTSVDLYSYYLEKAKKNPKEMLKYVHQVGGSYFAYYEFKYFILKYLEHCRYRHKEQYQALMQNMALRKAFTQIDAAFSNLIAEFMNNIKRIKTDLIPYTDQEIRLWPGSISIDLSGAGYFQKEVDLFKKALAKRSIVRIEEAFKIK